MAPLYTRKAPSARNFVHRSVAQLQRPAFETAMLVFPALLLVFVIWTVRQLAGWIVSVGHRPVGGNRGDDEDLDG